MRRLVPASVLLTVVLAGCGTATSTSGGSTAADTEPSPSTSAPATPDAAAASPSDAEPSAEAGAAGDGAKDVPDSLSFTAKTVGGDDFDAATLAGKPTVLWFWAPWCPTCRAQIDGVSTLAETYAGDVNVVGVGSLDSSGAIDDFADDVPAEEVTQLSDPDGAVWRHFGITSQSTYVVLDSAGTPVIDGYLDDEELARIVGDLVG